MQVGVHFGWLLDGFLIDFGTTLGAKLGPSWQQNRKKWGTKAMSENHQKSTYYYCYYDYYYYCYYYYHYYYCYY